MRKYEELKNLYTDAVLTEEQLSNIEAEIPETCELENTSSQTGIICIGENEDGSLFRFEAGQYKITNTETGESFYFYG